MRDTPTDDPGADTPTPARPRRDMSWRTGHTTGAWLAVLLALLGVFAMYRRPDFLLTLADQLWSCF